MARRVATPAAIRRLDRKFRDLDIAKRRLDSILKRKLPELIRLGAADLPVKIRKKIEDQINAEGHMERIIGARFAQEAARSTGRRQWAPLAISTLRTKRGPSILRETDRLMNSAVRAVRGTFPSYEG